MKFTEAQRNMVIKKWKLSDLEFAKRTSHNDLFFCKSELYGDCVLKLYGLMWEYHALCEYGSTNKFCKVYEFDSETHAMLMERVIPGDTLKEEPLLEKRLAVFSTLFRGLHTEPKNPEQYASYLNMVCDVTHVMKTRDDTKELYPYAFKMKELYLQMSSVYNKKALLHWDMNNENILLCRDGSYKLIDPMGLIGDPVMEIGRYMSKEYSDSISENRLEIVDKMADYFEANLNIPKNISKQCLYIDIIFLNCHFVEHGIAACMDDMRFAETLCID